MPYCALNSCKSSSKNNKKNQSSEITFHRFLRPGHENRNIWIKFVRKERCEDKWKPSLHSRLCSLHFRDEDFDFKDTGRRFLKKTAVPYNDLLCVIKTKPVTQSSSVILYDKSEKTDTDLDSDNSDISDADASDDEDLKKLSLSKSKSGTSGKCKDKPGQCYETKCSDCQEDIIGCRYICVQCPNVELCGACEARPAHATHYVLRVPELRPQWEVKEMLSRVRELVGRELLPWPKPKVDEQEMMKIEIKQEGNDPLREIPNSRPHKLNILEQALVEFPLIKGEFDNPDKDILPGETSSSPITVALDSEAVTGSTTGSNPTRPAPCSKRRRIEMYSHTAAARSPLQEADQHTPAKVWMTSPPAHIDPGDFTVFTHIAHTRSSDPNIHKEYAAETALLINGTAVKDKT